MQYKFWIPKKTRLKLERCAISKHAWRTSRIILHEQNQLLQETNHFGYGTSSDIELKMLKQKEIAVLITLLDYHRKMVMICRCFLTRERYMDRCKITNISG
jgi:hypothetical protein